MKLTDFATKDDALETALKIIGALEKLAPFAEDIVKFFEAKKSQTPEAVESPVQESTHV